MAHLALLILSAMLLINVVMIKLAEKHLVQTKLQTGRLLLNTLTQKVGNEIACRNKSWEALGPDSHFKVEVDQVLGTGDFSEALVLDKHGTKVFSCGTWGGEEKSAMSLSRETLVTRNLSFDFYGTVWGVVWLASERINMSAPVFIEGRFVGVVTIGAHLSPLYQTLREAENVILFYIALNTIILVLFGVYLLSRTVVKPIHELLNITDEFKDMDSVPALADSSPNEIGQLFRSLNLMLNRLEQNKKEQKDYISSLETANLEIKKAQDEIIRSEKFASVGRLATGVAHEIGNPIGIVLGYLELLRDNDLGKEEKQDYLSRMESEVTRINQIIRDLLDFSRGSGGSVTEVGVHELITETIYMLTPQPMMAHVRMKHTFEASEDIVKADPNQLKQVFLNIIMNAADAMGEDASTNILTIKSENKGHFIELRFTDTGPGITPEEIVHIFDPFFSTKDPGKGTGLGLSVCYSIIDGLGGEIRAESTVGKETTILISLPLYKT
jgi:two-component system NtrC family sensor kinase